MIQHACFSCEPWEVRETELDLAVLAHTESILALANGHIGMRANLEEGEPHGLPGTYLNSFYETRPLPYAEGGYGYPEAGQTLRQRHQRQDRPGCSSTTSPSTSATASCAATSAARPSRRTYCLANRRGSETKTSLVDKP